MLTPCQQYAKDNGFEALDRLFFTTARRAEDAKAMCAECPARVECADASRSVRNGDGSLIDAEGVWGGEFRG